MINVEIKESGNVKVVTLSGCLTIDYASEIKKNFLDAISRSKSVRVSFDKIEEVDFSFLQLLQAVKISVNKKKKNLALIAPLPPALENAAANLGISLAELCPVKPGE